MCINALWWHTTFGAAMLLPADIPLIEANLAKAGLSPSDLCREAGIATTTWWRWRDGKFQPRMSVWNGVISTYNRLTDREVSR